MFQSLGSDLIVVFLSLLGAIATSWGASRLLKQHAIKDIVSTANATIELYAKKAEAMEKNWTQALAELSSAKVELTAAKDRIVELEITIRKLIVGGSNVQVPLGEPVPGSNQSQKA